MLGGPRKTEPVRWTVLARKAMSLHERECAPAHETRMLGGIACYWIPDQVGNDTFIKEPEDDNKREGTGMMKEKARE